MKKKSKSKFSIYVLGARFFNHSLRAWKESAGQSLIEIIIGLAIGSILIGASALAVASMLNSNVATQKWRVATALSQGLLNNAKAYGSIDWQNLYGLVKSSSTQYFLNASGTSYTLINGNEGMLDNDVTNGLVGEWKFDEYEGTTSTLTYDASGNRNNGTLVNGPVRATSTCKIGNCISSNGTSTYVLVADSNSLDIAGNLTLSAWVKWNQFKNYGIVAQKNTGGGTSFINYGIWSYDGYLAAYIGNGVASNNVSRTYLLMGVSVGNWYLVTFVVDGSYLRLYINGQQANSSVQTVTPAANAHPFTISEPTYSINGYIDDVRVYNRALSADEVKQLYGANIFTRYFYVEDTCRTNDASSSISGVAPCDGGSADDPSTQKVSSVTKWATRFGTSQLSFADYVTRWKNTIFQQNDWSGGANASGVVTNPTNLFSSSSNANFSGKSIRIQGL